MPWGESNHMDERIKFVARLLDGENMSRMCREFGISRKTGYKIFNRYKDFGLAGLQDQSRRPHRYANKLPFQVEKAIIQIKQDRPTWGAPKIRAKLIRNSPCFAEYKILHGQGRCWGLDRIFHRLNYLRAHHRNLEVRYNPGNR